MAGAIPLFMRTCPRDGKRVLIGHFEERVMLQLAVVFLLIALLAGTLGLSGIAAVSTDIAWIVFFVFLVLFVISLLGHYGRGRPGSTV